MYPIKWYVKVLKEKNHTREKLIGNIPKGYSMQDAMLFCIECKKDFINLNRPIWDQDEDAKVVGELLEGNSFCFEISHE